MNKWVIGNWKMYGDLAMAGALARACAVSAAASPQHVHTVLCPPAPLLAAVAAAVQATPVKIGGQDCRPEENGAFTGDISALMLKDVGCSYVILGHSERRAGHGETSHLVRQKAVAAIANGLTPVICIGETLGEREAGQAEAVVAQQIQQSLPESGHFLLAYEPVWAIGSGKTPSTGDIAQMHAHIIAVTSAVRQDLAGPAPVLYGGSVKAANAGEILALEGVAGVLVGGASLKADEFCKIIEAA